MSLTSMGASRDTQFRALKLLKVVLEGGGREIFEYAYKTMSNRWERLNKAVSVSQRFFDPENCTSILHLFRKNQGTFSR